MKSVGRLVQISITRWKTRSSQPPKIALHGAGGDADDGSDERQNEAEEDGDAKAVERPRGDVARLVVGAEIVGAEPRRAEFAVEPLLPEPPGRRRWRRLRQRVVDGPVREGDGGPDHPALLIDHLRDERVTILGLGGEVAAEHCLGISDEDGKIEGVVIVHDQWAIVGNDLGEEADDEEHEKDVERPIAAGIAAKAPKASLGDRAESEVDPEQARQRRGGRRPHQTCRLSKSIRGSMIVYMRSPISPRTRPSSEKKKSVPSITG